MTLGAGEAYVGIVTQTALPRELLSESVSKLLNFDDSLVTVDICTSLHSICFMFNHKLYTVRNVLADFAVCD